MKIFPDGPPHGCSCDDCLEQWDHTRPTTIGDLIFGAIGAILTTAWSSALIGAAVTLFR